MRRTDRWSGRYACSAAQFRRDLDEAPRSCHERLLRGAFVLGVRTLKLTSQAARTYSDSIMSSGN